MADDYETEPQNSQPKEALADTTQAPTKTQATDPRADDALGRFLATVEQHEMFETKYPLQDGEPTMLILNWGDWLALRDQLRHLQEPAARIAELEASQELWRNIAIGTKSQLAALTQAQAQLQEAVIVFAHEVRLVENSLGDVVAIGIAKTVDAKELAADLRTNLREARESMLAAVGLPETQP